MGKQLTGRTDLLKDSLCADASAASLACLEKNSTQRELCSSFFTAYRECKKKVLADAVAARRAKNSGITS